MRPLIEATFWICAGGVFYVYAGYPFLVWLSARLVPHPVAKEAFTGQVSVVISVRNEASLICSKMEQLLASPDAALVAEVLVGSSRTIAPTYMFQPRIVRNTSAPAYTATLTFVNT